MIGFIKINNFYDIENLNNLFINKKYIGKGRIQIGEYYFSIKENSKTYMILIEDLDKRNIVNCIYSKIWFERNTMKTIKNIINNIKKDSYNM